MIKSIIVFLILTFTLAGDTHVVVPTPKISVENIQKLERVSFYTLSEDETDSTPNIAACGHVGDIPMIAVSRDLRSEYPCGTEVIIFTDIGIFRGIVYDTMNARYQHSVDILVSSKHQAFQLGVTHGIIKII